MTLNEAWETFRTSVVPKELRDEFLIQLAFFAGATWMWGRAVDPTVTPEQASELLDEINKFNEDFRISVGLPEKI